MDNAVVVRLKPEGVSEPGDAQQVVLEGRDQFSRPIIVYVLADVEPGEQDVLLVREVFRRLLNAASRVYGRTDF